MQHLVIGDIHGCWEELQELLEAAALGGDDQVIAVGDIVDRGPDSPRVLEFFGNGNGGNAKSLMGNHERKHVRSLRGQVRPALSQLITRRQIGEAAYPNACDTMNRFARYLELSEVVVAHGFFEPGRAISHQEETVVVGTLSAEQRLLKKYDRPWYELYDGEKPLIVGHHDYRRDGQPLIVNDRVYAIDTGCCHGGRLTGLLLPHFRLISVPSRRDYWTRLQDEHADLRYSSTPDDRLTWEAAEKIAAQRTANVPIDVTERAQRVRALLSEGERAIERLFQRISDLHERILKQIAADIDIETIRQKELARRYARKLGKSPLAGYLHQLRTGELQRDTLKDHFKGPAAAIQFARKIDESA